MKKKVTRKRRTRKNPTDELLLYFKKDSKVIPFISSTSISDFKGEETLFEYIKDIDYIHGVEYPITSDKNPKTYTLRLYKDFNRDFYE